MNRLLYLTIIIPMITLFAGEGKINITSNKPLAYIYVDGEKKAMTGDRGVTTITVEEGEHVIKLIKPKNKKQKRDYVSSSRIVLIAVGSSINLKFILDEDKP